MGARLDRITRRAHILAQLLEDGISIRAADMPGTDDLSMRVHAAMAQKERELISEGTRGGVGIGTDTWDGAGWGQRLAAAQLAMCRGCCDEPS